MRSPEDPDDALQSLLAELASSARAANLARCDVVADGLQAVAGERLDEAMRAAAAAAAHQIVGSAGTFGFTDASRRAGELERYFERGGGAEGLADARRELDELRRDLEAGHQPEE